MFTRRNQSRKSASTSKISRAIGQFFDDLEQRQMLTTVNISLLEGSYQEFEPKLPAYPTYTTVASLIIGEDTKGSAEITGSAPNQKILFTPPDSDFFGESKFQYVLTDPTTHATTTIDVDATVTSVNDAPSFEITASPDWTGDEDAGSIAVDNFVTNIKAGPANESTQALTFHVSSDNTGLFTTQPAIDSAGKLTFTLTPNAHGQATVSVYLTDDGGTDNGGVDSSLDPENPVEFIITVNPVNDAPVARDDKYTTTEDTAQLSATGGNSVLLKGTDDGDVDGDKLSVVAINVGEVSFAVGSEITLASGALLKLNADGTFTYKPNGKFEYLDDGKAFAETFTYTISDGNGGMDDATVTITVNGVNDAPVANNDAYSVDEDTTLTVAAAGVMANDTDVDVEPLTASLGVGPTNAKSFTFNADGSFSYVPNDNYNGVDTFTYLVNDGTVNSAAATVTITVNPVNDAPVANDDAFSVDEDTDLVITPAQLMANDSDVEGDTLAVMTDLVTPPTHGTVTFDSKSNTFKYTPVLNYNGPDSFQYSLSDGTLTSVATVNITVNPVNDAPVGIADSYSATEDTKLTITAANGVLANDSDIETPQGEPDCGDSRPGREWRGCS